MNKIRERERETHNAAWYLKFVYQFFNIQMLNYFTFVQCVWLVLFICKSEKSNQSIKNKQ